MFRVIKRLGVVVLAAGAITAGLSTAAHADTGAPSGSSTADAVTVQTDVQASAGLKTTGKDKKADKQSADKYCRTNCPKSHEECWYSHETKVSYQWKGNKQYRVETTRTYKNCRTVYYTAEYKYGHWKCVKHTTPVCRTFVCESKKYTLVCEKKSPKPVHPTYGAAA